MSALIVWALTLATGHAIDAPRTVALAASAPTLRLVISYTVTPASRAAQLRALADRDRDGTVGDAERAWLEATLHDEATAGVRLSVDGVPLALRAQVRAAVGSGGPTQSRAELGIIVDAVAASPVWCGIHRVAVRAPPRGLVATLLRWPDGVETRLADDAVGARWLRICGG